MEANLLKPNLTGSLEQSALKRAELLGGKAVGDATQRRKIAREFATLLYQEVLKSMRRALDQDAQSSGEAMPRDFYHSMMDGEVARLMAQRDSTGFVKTVERSLERLAPAALLPKPTIPVPTEAPTVIVDPVVHNFHLPTSGVISSAYGHRVDPIDRAQRFHQGIDIAAPAGTPIRSAAAGRVIFSGIAPGYGNLVEIDHGGGWVTRYGHNAQNSVSPGDVVQAGQQVATVGRTGRATGDHLHFEVRRDGRAVNPNSFLESANSGRRLSVKI